MTAGTVLALFGASGVGAVLAAIVAGLFSRRRLSAEATEIITRAASGVVENLKSDNEDLRERIESLELEAENARDVLQLHAAWDSMAVASLREAGITNLPAPPPLRVPPIRRTHQEG